MSAAVIVDQIHKQYKAEKSVVQALQGISLEVPQGELFGIVGPDGAGKTSLFRILTTLILPDRGKAVVGGFDTVKQYREIRKRVGYMPGRFSLYQDLTVEENLNFFATIFHTSLQENYHLIKNIYTQIEPFKNRRAGKLSGGMKQKLALCCALIHKPEILFLNEPTTGVDAVSRKEFWDMLQDLKREGITILVSTPYMDEAGLCDRVALMQNGKLLAVDAPDAICQSFAKPLWAVKAADGFGLLHVLRGWEEVASSFSFGEYIHVVMKDDRNGAAEIRSYLDGFALQQLEVLQIQASIEDSFMDLMNENDD